jgi:5'-deoxynucleotidase YfbR-like HD superfamily hydrolase
MMTSRPTIPTVTGRRVDLLVPLPHQISLIDMAVGLSRITRWYGQLRRCISVAEHSVHVYNFVTSKGAREDVRRYALFHDAHEYLNGDATRPVKRALREIANGLQSQESSYDLLSHTLQMCIHKAVGIDFISTGEAHMVKSIDDACVILEAHCFANPKLQDLNEYTISTGMLSLRSATVATGICEASSEDRFMDEMARDACYRWGIPPDDAGRLFLEAAMELPVVGKCADYGQGAFEVYNELVKEATWWNTRSVR